MGNAFITVYMTKNPKMDRHPHHDYGADFTVLQRLAESVAPYGELIIATDTLTDEHVPSELRDAVTIRPTPTIQGNFFMERWDVVRDVLTERADLDLVYIADGRDVIVRADPWGFIERGNLYSCVEPRRLPWDRRWRGQPLWRSGFITDRAFHSSPVIQEWIQSRRATLALNAGVTAGGRDTLLRFAARMADARREEHVRDDYTDMALYNYVAHREFRVIGDEAFIGAKGHTEEHAPQAKVLHVP